MNYPCCERQIPQDEALYKSRLLRADDPLPHPFGPCNYAKMPRPTPVWALPLCKNAFEMSCPCCERQIPQDEALYKSRLLRADDPPPHPFGPHNYAKMP